MNSDRYSKLESLGVNMSEDSIPMPLAHKPNTRMHYISKACKNATVKELGTKGAWITMDTDHTMPVKE